MRHLSWKTVVIGVSVLGILSGGAAAARAQAAPAHPAGHEGMKSDHAMMMPKDDASYVLMMQMHHQQGIDMAKVALQRSSDPRVLSIAQDIVLAQAKEMYDFRTWLLKQ